MTNLLVVVLLLVLIAIRMPIAFALAIAGSVGLVMVDGLAVAANHLSSIPFARSSGFTLTLIPMFILMGLFVSHAGIITPLYAVLARLTRRIPGGLALSTVAGCALFGGISGSSAADAALLGRLSIGEMTSRGYDKGYAAAVVACSGTLSILIPPSIVLVIYGIVTGESIGRLLLAGLIPGAITAVLYAAVTVFRSHKPGRRASTQNSDLDDVAPPPLSLVVLGVVGGGVLFTVVIGGIYVGVFTPTEAGAVGAAASALISLLYLVVAKRKKMVDKVWRPINDALQEAVSITAMIFALVIGGAIFSQFLVVSGIPRDATRWVADLPVPPTVVVILLLLALVPLGMLIDGLSMLLIVTPVLYPIVTAFGFDGIWFGILMVKAIEVGLITPPVGLNIYVVGGLHDDLPVERIFRHIGAFLVADIVAIGLLFAFPILVLLIPNLSS